MNITKRDIADVALVWIAATFVFGFLGSLATTTHYFGVAGRYQSLFPGIIFQGIRLVAYAAICWALLFRRDLVLDRLFPNADSVVLPDASGLQALVSYAFWIRMFGVFTFLKSSIGLIGPLMSVVSVNDEFRFTSIDRAQIIISFVAALLSLVIVRKADWISKILIPGKSSTKSIDGDP